MKSAVAVLAAAAALLPAAISAQEADVARRSFTFIDNRLEVAVVSPAAGELHVLRGDRGRVDVAARTATGVPAFGLGGGITRQLRLTATGGPVDYVVVVPERVALRVLLPDGSTADLAPSTSSAAWRWQAQDEVMRPDGRRADPAAPATRQGSSAGFSFLAAPATVPGDVGPGGDYFASRVYGAGGPSAHDGAWPFAHAGDSSVGTVLPLVHVSEWVPEVIDVPDFTSIRRITVRVEGSDFRVAASRPLAFAPGSRSRLEIRVGGEPLDLIFYVPPSASLTLTSGGRSLVEAGGGEARTPCSNAVVGSSVERSWVTLFGGC